ncbi:MAG: hypothetical protein IJY25_00600 [Bacilli bacterium]|nr:hypothetical protein [Bacilli bacterium]
MCKLGDIIVVKEFKNEIGEIIPKHSFVVINDENDYVEGLKYDFVSNMLCSFHNKIHKSKKLKYKENLPIKEEYISGDRINAKEGFIKADQLYYFDKNLIEYTVIAHMEEELLDKLVKLILILHDQKKLKPITTNLKQTIETKI